MFFNELHFSFSLRLKSNCVLCRSVWGKLASANTRGNLITTAAQRRFQEEIERIAAAQTHFSLRLRPPPPEPDLTRVHPGEGETEASC